MKTIEEIKEEISKAYIALVDQLSDNAKQKKERFLAIDAKLLKSGNLVVYWWSIVEYYRAFCFFPDKEIKAKFKELGFSEIYLDWIIPLNSIEAEFDKIEMNDRLLVFKHLALKNIQQHLELKISHEVLKWAGLMNDLATDGKLYAETINLYKKKAYRKKTDTIPGNLGDLLLFQTIDELSNQIGSEEAGKKFFLKGILGDTDRSFLNQFYASFLRDDRYVSESELILTMYDLFRLICKDQNLPNEAEFDDLPDINEDKFHLYQVRKIRKLIYKK